MYSTKCFVNEWVECNDKLQTSVNHLSKLSSRRLIEILSNPTDDKRWKVVTILIGSYSYIFSTFGQLSNNMVTLGIFKVIYIHSVFIKTSGHNDICTHPCNTSYTSFDASPPMYRCVHCSWKENPTQLGSDDGVIVYWENGHTVFYFDHVLGRGWPQPLTCSGITFPGLT